jgi:ribose 5-phosphate isomerase B
MPKIYVASDHAALTEKLGLVQFLEKIGHAVIDCGPHLNHSCDYPDYARLVAECIKNDPNPLVFGVLLCGTGIGMSIACNMAGVTAARCTSIQDADLARRHNYAKVITVGARQKALHYICEMVEVFLHTKPDPDDRHRRRVAKSINLRIRDMK